MANQKRGWKQFQKLSFDSKRFSKRVKKAETATVRHARKFIVGRLDNIRVVRRNIIGWLIIVGCMLALVNIQMLWIQQTYQTTTPAAGGTYAEASLGSVDTLNPLYAESSAERIASQLIFSSLYTYDETGHLRGDLAESTKVNDAETVYTTTLRKNITWHDGQPVTAKDVAFTINLIKDPGSRSQLRTTWQDITVDVVDESTITFTLPATYASFRHAMTFAVLPEHILGDVDPAAVRENNFSRSPVGSGPFQFRILQNINVEQQQKVVSLSAFENYHGGAPLIGRFEIHSYANSEQILKALRAGEVNAASDLNGTDSGELDDKNYTVISRPIHSGVYALMNVDSAILSDKAIRQALQVGTDTAQIRKSLAVEAPKLELPFVKGQLTGDDIPTAPALDIKKSAAILDRAGWKRNAEGMREKKGGPLALDVVTTKNSDYEKALEVLAGQWRQLGVTVNVRVVDPTDPASNFVQNILQQRQYDVFLTELSIGADPDVYAYWHSSQIGMGGLNLSNYSNKSADSSLSTARSSVGNELRNVKYKTFAKQWLSDAPAIGLYQPTSQYAYNKHAISVKANEKLISSYDRYANVLYWSVSEKSVYKTP